MLTQRHADKSDGRRCLGEGSQNQLFVFVWNYFIFSIGSSNVHLSIFSSSFLIQFQFVRQSSFCFLLDASSCILALRTVIIIIDACLAFGQLVATEQRFLSVSFVSRSLTLTDWLSARLMIARFRVKWRWSWCSHRKNTLFESSSSHESESCILRNKDQ